MKSQKLHIYYDAEGDYLELRFGEATDAHFDKIGDDTYARIDEKTGKVKGYAIFNVKKSDNPLKILDVDVPANALRVA